MKKNYLLLVFLVTCFATHSQYNIKGKVLSYKKLPLEGASVYSNNTTFGTITNSKGEFEFKINEGIHDLVVSFIGFETQQIKINTNTPIVSLTFTLKPNTNLLDEVKITKTIYDNNWKYNLFRFKLALLGRNQIAKTCRILNEKELHFNFDVKTNTLTAFAKKPLKIKHSGLGYLITYDLIDFTLEGNNLFYSGYARYENLKKSIKKKWVQNRRKAYNGSKMHFFRSIITNTTKEEGFIINQFKRLPNLARPSDEKIKQARDFLKLHKGPIYYSKKIITPKTSIDSALVIVRKESLSKFADYMYKTDISSNTIAYKNEGSYFLNFDNYLSVVYTKEPEELGYVTSIFGKKREPLNSQTSNIILFNGSSEINFYGILNNPNSIFTEGYWSYESFANMLPLDYIP